MCVCDVSIFVQLNQLQCCEWIFFFDERWVGCVLSIWEGLYSFIWFSSNCKENEIMLSPYRKNLKSTWTNSVCLYNRIYLTWHPQARSLNIPFVKQYLCWPKLLKVIFLLCFFRTYLVKNPVSLAAIMILWLVAVPWFLIISHVSGIVNIVSHIVPAAPHFLILFSVEANIIAQWTQWNLYCIMWNHSIIMHTGRFRHQSSWNWGLVSSSAEVSGFLKYELNIKVNVLFLKLP